MKKFWDWITEDRIRWGVFLLSLVLFLLWLTHYLGLDIFEELL